MRSIPRRLIVTAVVVAVLTGLALVSDVGAVQKGGQKKKKKNAFLTNTQLVQVLVDARTLVHNANHDYKGYRAKAGHQIRQAIHALEPKHKHPQLPAVNSGNKEPQAVSDKQLQEALLLLQSAQTQLNGQTGQHHITANTHVNNAILDLQTALKIN